MSEFEELTTTSEESVFPENASVATTSGDPPHELQTTGLDRSPLHVYLSRLSEGSRPTMSEALSTVARIASGGHLEAHQLPWL